MAEHKGIFHFYAKVVGVTHRNDDRTRRQEIIDECELFERLVLDHEPDNPKDPNAIRVLRENGDQIGYLDARLAKETVNRSAAGARQVAFITGITGGTDERPTQGVNIIIIVADADVTDEEAQTYLNALNLGRNRNHAAREPGNGVAEPGHNFVMPGMRAILERAAKGQQEPPRSGCTSAVLAFVLLLIGLLSLIR